MTSSPNRALVAVLVVACAALVLVVGVLRRSHALSSSAVMKQCTSTSDACTLQHQLTACETRARRTPVTTSPPAASTAAATALPSPPPDVACALAQSNADNMAQAFVDRAFRLEATWPSTQSSAPPYLDDANDFDIDRYAWYVPRSPYSPERTPLFLDGTRQQRPRIAFAKSFKVGGSTVSSTLMRHALLHHELQCPFLDLCEMYTLHPHRYPQVASVASLADRRQGRALLLGIVRDPLARSMSMYFKSLREQHLLDGGNSLGAAAERRRFFDAWRERNVRYTNHMVGIIRGSISSLLHDDTGTPDDFLRDAVATFSMLDFVIVNERMDESLVVLAHLLHWRLEEMAYYSQKVHEYDTTWVDESVRSWVASNTKEDKLLYHFANATLDRWIARIDDFDAKVNRLRTLHAQFTAACDRVLENNKARPIRALVPFPTAHSDAVVACQFFSMDFGDLAVYLANAMNKTDNPKRLWNRTQQVDIRHTLDEHADAFPYWSTPTPSDASRSYFSLLRSLDAPSTDSASGDGA